MKTHNKNPEAGRLAEEACRLFPKEPSNRLARMLHAKHPNVFRTIEHARRRVRYYRGKYGAYHRSHAKSTRIELNRPNGTVWDDLPEPRRDLVWKPVDLDAQVVLSLSDVHIPWHSTESLRPALQYGLDKNADCVLLNGDFLDMYEVSKFEREKRKEDLADTFRSGYTVLSLIRDAFPDAKIVWKFGNHEERWSAWMNRHGREFFEMEFTHLEWVMSNPSCYGMDAPADLGIQYVTDRIPLKIGRLWILHGHEIPKSPSNPVNAARGAQLKTGECVLLGHFHQVSQHSITTLADRMISCWSQGCLCDLHPRYSPINPGWGHGFALITREDEDNFTVENKKIIKGKVY